MKHLRPIIVMIFFVSSGIIYAQDAIDLSLSRAFAMGLTNRYDAQANKLNIDLANNAVKRSQKEWLPDINVSIDIKYNTQLQTSVIGGFGEIKMGTKNYTGFSLDLTQSIYKPGLNTDIKIAQNAALLEQEKRRENDILIKQSIAKVYLNVILRKVQWNIATEASGRNSEFSAIAEKKFKLGVLLENDYLKSTLYCKNAELSEVKAKHNYDLAMMQLKYQLNIKNSTIIILTDSIENFKKENTNTLSGNYERTELKQLELQYSSNELYFKKCNYYFLPTVSFVANYTTEFQAENYHYSRNGWSPFNYVGIKLNMPIYTGNLKNVNTKTEYRIKMAQTELNIKQKQQEINTEILQYKTELDNAENAIEMSKNNLELAKKVHQSQLNAFQLGTATYSSILDAENSLTTSDQNYIEAVYSYLLSKINYEKVIGKL